MNIHRYQNQINKLFLLKCDDRDDRDDHFRPKEFYFEKVLVSGGCNLKSNIKSCLKFLSL
jgi:hypothetical protein